MFLVALDCWDRELFIIYGIFRDSFNEIQQQWQILFEIPSHTPSIVVSMFLMLLIFLGDSLEEITGYGTMRPKNLISSLLGQTPVKSKSLAISNPHDFRQVIFIDCWKILLQ